MGLVFLAFCFLITAMFLQLLYHLKKKKKTKTHRDVFKFLVSGQVSRLEKLSSAQERKREMLKLGELAK